MDRDAFVPHNASKVCTVIVTYVFILVMTNDVYRFWKVRKLLNELEKFSNLICTVHTYSFCNGSIFKKYVRGNGCGSYVQS